MKDKIQKLYLENTSKNPCSSFRTPGQALYDVQIKGEPKQVSLDGQVFELKKGEEVQAFPQHEPFNKTEFLKELKELIEASDKAGLVEREALNKLLNKHNPPLSVMNEFFASHVDKQNGK